MIRNVCKSVESHVGMKKHVVYFLGIMEKMVTASLDEETATGIYRITQFTFKCAKKKSDET